MLQQRHGLSRFTSSSAEGRGSQPRIMARFVASLFLLAGCAALSFVGPLPGRRSTALRATNGDQEAVSTDTQAPEKLEQAALPTRFGSALLAMLVAVAFAWLPVQEAQAARSGGRIGGSAGAVRRAPPRAPPRAPAAASSSNTTVINKTTVVAPPPVMAAPSVGFGMGVAPVPVVVAPPPTVGDVIVGSVVGGAINNAMYGGHHSGPSTTDRMLENQQRQDERQIDNQQREIEQLKNELNSLKAQK